MGSRSEQPVKKARRAKAPGDSLERRLSACYASLPKSERQVADLLLNFPGQLATHSATEVAALSGTSKAAVTRLIQRLGYASYSQARSDVRGAQQWGSPIYLDSDPPAAQPRGRSHVDAHIAADIEILHKTLENLDDAVLDDVTAALADARRVVVIGHRNSALLASYARTQLGLLRSGVELAPMHGETLAEGLYGLGAQDLLFAVGFRRRVPAFMSALELARRSGARTLLLTDPSGAAMAKQATWVIACHCRGASIFDSYVAAVSLINFVATRLVALLGVAGRTRLREIERLHEELGDLV